MSKARNIHGFISQCSSEPFILILTYTKPQLDLALIVAEASKHNYIIFNPDIDPIMAMDTERYNMTRMILEYGDLLTIIPLADKIIIFVGEIVQSVPQNFQTALKLALQLRKPVIEVPHGLFQPGFNITDDSQFIVHSSFYYGSNNTLLSLAHKKISWYLPDGVGFPRTLCKNAYPKRILPKYTLITTNTNWYLYSLQDKIQVLTYIRDHAVAHPNELFIWQPHPAEIISNTSNTMPCKYIFNMRPANVLEYGITKDIYFHGIDSTEDLIAYCSRGISTVSTCIIDFEIHRKPIHVFECEGTKNLSDSFESCSLFSSSADLDIPPKQIRTGYLKDFDVQAFDAAVESAVYIEDNTWSTVIEALESLI